MKSHRAQESTVAQLQADSQLRSLVPQCVCLNLLSFSIITDTLSGLRPTLLGVIGGTLVGYLGQTGYNSLDKKNTEAITSPVAAKEPLWRRIANSKYSPMTVLTDKQYEALLREKLLRVDTEIAVLDDDISKLRKESEIEKSKS
jgi:hypothetical protein